MAPTFSFMNRTSTPAPPTSATQPSPADQLSAAAAGYHGQMPHVVVVPPEEDDEAPYTCFDAAAPHRPDLDAHLDDYTFEPFDPDEHDRPHPDISHPADGEVYAFQASPSRPPIFARGRDSEMMLPRRTAGQTLSEEDRAELRALEGPGNDSEVVEVIKVRRHGKLPTDSEEEEEQDEAAGAAGMRRTTFIARAFRSIRKASKGKDTAKGRGKTPDVVGDVPRRGSVSSMQPSVRRRRSSVLLTNIFRPSQESVQSATESEPPSPSPSSLTSPSSPSLLQSATSPSQSVPSLSISQESENTTPLAKSPALESTPIAEPSFSALRSPSPAPSTRSTRRRFSMLRLNRIFSSSAAPEEIEPSADGSGAGQNGTQVEPIRLSDGSERLSNGSVPSITSAPSMAASATSARPPSMSRDSTPSTVAGSMPQTPVEEMHMSLGDRAGMSIGDCASVGPGDGAEQTPRPSRSFSKAADYSVPTVSNTGETKEVSSPGSPLADSSFDMLSDMSLNGMRLSDARLSNGGLSDTSLEMQLDSLHFDNLSFDVENFMQLSH